MNYQTAKFAANLIDDLEHKIRVAAPACYPEFDRDLLDQSLITVLKRKKDSARVWDEYIKNDQELFLLLAYNNQCLAEEALRLHDVAGALIFVAEGNFEIGGFYASHHIVRVNKKDAAKAPRPNALKILIQKEVRKKPDISEKELLQRLIDQQGGDVIQDITDIEIWYTHNGKTKTAPISGLRNRLSRVKNPRVKNQKT